MTDRPLVTLNLTDDSVGAVAALAHTLHRQHVDPDTMYCDLFGRSVDAVGAYDLANAAIYMLAVSVMAQTDDGSIHGDEEHVERAFKLLCGLGDRMLNATRGGNTE